MNPISNTEAESLLIAWGAWVRGNYSLDLSKVNMLHRWNKEGAGVAHTTVRTEPHMPATVEVVEQCVLHTMPKTVRRACMHRYVGNESDHKARKALRLTQGEYEQRINQACHILADYLIEN